MTAYRVYITSTITDPSSAVSLSAYNLIALLASLETLLGIITACLPMLKPVGTMIWTTLPKSGRNKIASMTSAAGSLLVRAGRTLSLSSSKEHGSRSFLWFSTSAKSMDGSSGTAGADQAPPTPEKDEVWKVKAGQIVVRKDIDLESAMSDR